MDGQVKGLFSMFIICFHPVYLVFLWFPAWNLRFLLWDLCLWQDFRLQELVFLDFFGNGLVHTLSRFRWLLWLEKWHERWGYTRRLFFLAERFRFRAGLKFPERAFDLLP